MSEETKKTPRVISRREFLRDAGIVVGGTAVSSAFFLSACGDEVEVTKTVTTTAPGSTVTTTAPGATSTVTKTAADNTVTVTKYTCPVCNQEFDSLEALKAHYDSQHIQQDSQKTTGQKVVNFNVNGEEQKLLVDTWDTLKDVLRRQLGLTSIKDMCTGQGACGSCTVIMDGRPILSCMTLACECEGTLIETAEGIALKKDPLIDTYTSNYCMQCGYCTPGFVVTAKALLDRNPSPTEEDIRDALAGNLCRCATYRQHIPAVLEAAEARKGGG
jgi:aerobic-type carbon monoxide dehydrogenase small subunit (CoxS/CutS family)